MLDLGSFSNENFDPKKWINSACQSRHPQDSLDKHLVDMEMKLQMVSEEIAASLEEQSAAALLRVPRATRDVIRLRDDAVSLRSAVSSILQKLKKVRTQKFRIGLGFQFALFPRNHTSHWAEQWINYDNWIEVLECFWFPYRSL